MLASDLDKPRSARSLEAFGVDAGVATTEGEHTEVPNCGGSGGCGPQRLGGHAQVQRILRTRHECLAVITAAHEKRVREDLTSPGSRGGGSGTKRNIFLTTEAISKLYEGLSCWLRQLSTRAELEDSSASTQCCARTTGYSSPQRRTVATVWPGMAYAGSLRPRRPARRLVTRRSLSSHRLAQGSGETAKKQLKAPTGKGIPKVKSENFSAKADSCRTEASLSS